MSIGVGVVLVGLVVRALGAGNKLLSGVGAGGVCMYRGLERVALGRLGLVNGLATAGILTGALVGELVRAVADE